MSAQTFSITGRVTGRLRLEPIVVALEEVRGVYARLMDDRRLPDVEGRPAGDPWSARCRELHDDDLCRLGRIRWCPVQFQERVEGFDVRVHCAGGEVHACRIVSDAVDYRYAVHQVGSPAALEPYALDGDLATRCLALTDALGLELSGIDLRLDGDGRAWCFEVNPSPAFSYYEHHTGLPIARAIARHLAAA